MVRILSLETSTTVCSVAVHEDGKLLAIAEVYLEHSHAAKLATLIDEVLKISGIEMRGINAVAISSGPGSYTGLRIGTSTAKGLCYALGLPLLAIGTLELLAAQVNSVNVTGAWLCPMIDARRMEVYCRLSDRDDKVIQEVEAKVIDEKSFEEFLSDRQVIFFGDGAEKCKSVITHTNASFITGINPSAGKLGVMAFQKYLRNDVEDLVRFEPFYLKEFRVKKPADLIAAVTNKMV